MACLAHGTSPLFNTIIYPQPAFQVLVLKPPMVFSEANVDTFVGAIVQELEGLADVDLSTVKHTPT